MKKLLIFIVLGIILSINGGFASIAANSSVYLRNTLYSPGDSLNATAVLGLDNEKANSKVVITIGGKNASISLLDFLEKAGLADSAYQCTNDCQNTYNVSGDGKSEIALKAGENIVGINIITNPEESVSVQTLEFKLSPSNTVFKKGCGESVVKIDVLDNGIDWQFLNASEFSYACDPLSLNDECYNEDATKEFGITSFNYCEKKFLKETSKVKLAAKVRKAAEVSTGDLKMLILDPSDNMDKSDECDLTGPASTDYSVQDCVLDYNVKKAGDYYICIYDDKYSSGNAGAGYYILGERVAPVCGFVSSILGVKADFALYSQIANIAEFPAFSLNNKLYKEATGDELDSAINKYLSSFYSSLCDKGCIIPINIITTEGAKISDLKASYFSEALLSPPSPFDIYNIVREPPLISMAKKTINLDFLGLTVNGIGSYKLTLTVGNNIIGVNYFNVSSIPKIYSVIPKNPVAGVETSFFANVMSPAGYKITNYEWDFGDGTVETTGNNTVLHAYSVFGEHNLTLTVTDEKGTKASALFPINPQTPKDAVNSTISRKKSLLDSFMTAVKALPSWYAPIITKNYGTQDLNEKITQALKDFDEAEKMGVNETYLFIKDRLDAMLVPESLEETQTLEETDALLMTNEINPDYIKTLGGGTYKDAEEARSAIAAWQTENMNIKIRGSVKTVAFEDSTAEDALTIFQAKLIPLQSLKEKTYFVIVLPSGVSYEDVQFDKSYGQKKLDNAIGLSLSGTEETINFAMPGSQILAISMFASPPLNSLVFVPEIVTCGNGICDKETENSKNCREDCPATAKTVMWIAIIIILGAIGVFLIWKFYAVIYERMEQQRIFKTRKNYISLLIFVADALKKGFSEQQITEKLKKSGWNDEQISYTMKQSVKAEKKAEKKIQPTETKKQ